MKGARASKKEHQHQTDILERKVTDYSILNVLSFKKMEVLSCVALFAVMYSVAVEAGKFEKFVVNVEKLTKINAECKEIVEEQKETNANLTNRIEVLEAKNEALKSSLTRMQGTLYMPNMKTSVCCTSHESMVESSTDKILI